MSCPVPTTDEAYKVIGESIASIVLHGLVAKGIPNSDLRNAVDEFNKMDDWVVAHTARAVASAIVDRIESDLDQRE